MKLLVKTRRAFSLAELLIVVAILGILAALVIPEFQDHTKRAKEAAAKDNLRLLRQAFQRYELHNGVPPGYLNNDTSLNPNYIFLQSQLVNEYLSEIPENPFNNMSQIKVLDDATPFPASAQITETIGWYYKPATRIIRLNWPGTDTQGVSYFDY